MFYVQLTIYERALSVVIYGVRLGNVSIHKNPRCRYKNKQCWFPESWTRKDIKAAARHVLSLKKNQSLNKEVKTGYYKGVKVGVYDFTVK